MIFTKAQRRYVLNGLLETIFVISDKIYQERVWVLGKGPEVGSYDDTSCYVEDGISILDEYDRYGVTEVQYDILKIFYNEFEIFTENQHWNEWPPDWFYSKEWDKITKMAKEVLKAFKYEFKLPAEIPDNFEITTPTKQLCKNYYLSNNKHTYFRVTPAKHYSLYPAQQVPYVNFKVNGRSLNQKGEAVESDSADAYIPSEKFEYRNFDSKIDRKLILKEFLKNIFRLADEDYQQRVWIEAIGPECNEIDDAICDFFDDGGPIIESYRGFRITESQHKVLMDLYQALKSFSDKYGVYSSARVTEKLISQPEWQEIRELAKRVLEVFEFKQA